MNDSLAIRPAREADARTIAEFNQAMAQETEGLRLADAVIQAGVENLLRDPAKGRYFLAERDGAVVGQLLITYEWSDWRNGWFWWIQSVYVAPAARRGGVYRALYAHVTQAARDARDVCGVRLYVDRDNLSAQRVYERLGMTRTGYLLFEADWSATRDKG